MAGQNPNGHPHLCDHGPVIRKQFVRIEQLESQLAQLKLERDSLALENDRLAFQLEMMSEALKNKSGCPAPDSDIMLVMNSGQTVMSGDGNCINRNLNDDLSYIDHGPRKGQSHMHHVNPITNSPLNSSAGCHHQQYELSQQLIDKRVSCLERKYGGRNARDAAITIQRAWRTHRLQRRFATITIQAYNKQNINANYNIINSNANYNNNNINNNQPNSRKNSNTTDNNHLQDVNSNKEITSSSNRQHPQLNGSQSNNHNHHNVNHLVNNVNHIVNPVHESISNQSKSKRFSSTSASSSDDSSMSTSMSSVSSGGHVHVHGQLHVGHPHPGAPQIYTSANSGSQSQFECVRKRQYRVGLNLFNKTPPERGINFLVSNGFIEASPMNNEHGLAIATARFLLTRKGLSKQMIGEFISSNQPFNQLVLKYFSKEIDLSGLQVDVALRKFQTYFRFPGEAQKIERLVETFANRYIECNEGSTLGQQLSRDSVFILSFAIIMLNTDLHVPTNTKSRMTSQQWLNNLKGVFGGDDPDANFLLEIYDRVKVNELRTGADHVTQVLKVQQAIVGKDVPNLCLPHRRLVCYCRLYEIRDLTRKERPGQHQREIFLFNDLLLVTKLTSKSKNGHTAEYQYRNSIALDGLQVTLFTSVHHHFGIRLSRRVDDRLIIIFNARNELDRQRFVDDLKESVAEMDEMEQLRITKSNSMLQLNNHFAVDKFKLNLNSSISGTSIANNSDSIQMKSSLTNSQSTTFNQTTNLNSTASSTSSTSSSSSSSSSSNSNCNINSISNSQTRRCSSGSLDSGLSLTLTNQQQNNVNVNAVVIVESK